MKRYFLNLLETIIYCLLQLMYLTLKLLAALLGFDGRPREYEELIKGARRESDKLHGR